MKRRRKRRRKQNKKGRKGNRKISKNVRQQVLARDKVCQHCGTDGSTRNKLTLHHIKYRRHGGTSTPDNLITLCESCHQEHHKKMG